MPAFQLLKKNVVFVHIPKTGGSSIDDWLYSCKGCKRMLFSGKPLPDMKVTPQHISYQTIIGLLGKEFSIDYAFAIVRNPFKRLESEYKYRLSLGLLSGHKKPESLFASWVNYALNHETKTPGTLDNHLRPQSFFVAPEVNVLKFEDGLVDAAQTVCRELHIDFTEFTQFPHKKSSRKSQLQWTDKTIARVQRFYEKDFAEFGYDIAASELDRTGKTGVISYARQLYHFERKHKRISA
ncbi:sulfotransferase family 2 domain-containing protein [Salinimonas chungwhensis]|uniref:sulfotransferase family 2 domain-containing protein n=1 Tax=Salinimonas chungwhensis TaxID=265425 RepID=UPI001461491A|nr:sulfotransferase family 2 domain-containing protein [Salinimonas chungwhensis]